MPGASIRSKAEIFLLIITFFWGATFVVVKDALAAASPLPFIAARFVLAGLLLFLAFGRALPKREVLRPSIILGLLLFSGYVFQTWGQEYTTPSKCAFITAFGVVLVPLILAFKGSPMNAASGAGAALGIAGIYVLVAPSGPGGINRGDLLTLGCAVAFAVYIVLLADYSQKHSSAELVPVQILLVGVLACIGLPIDREWRWHWSLGLALAIVLTAVFATAIAFAVQNWAQRYVPPAHTALIFALEPVFAVITSLAMGNERLNGRAVAGSAMVLAGLVVSGRWGSSSKAAES